MGPADNSRFIQPFAPKNSFQIVSNERPVHRASTRARIAQGGTRWVAQSASGEKDDEASEHQAHRAKSRGAPCKSLVGHCQKAKSKTPCSGCQAQRATSRVAPCSPRGVCHCHARATCSALSQALLHNTANRRSAGTCTCRGIQPSPAAVNSRVAAALSI